MPYASGIGGQQPNAGAGGYSVPGTYAPVPNAGGSTFSTSTSYPTLQNPGGLARGIKGPSNWGNVMEEPSWTQPLPTPTPTWAPPAPATAPSGGSGWANGNPTQQRDYNEGAKQRMAQPSPAQSYYAAYRPSTVIQDYAKNRQTTGYGPNVLADRYTARAGSSAPNTLSGIFGDMSGWATSGRSLATDRMGARSDLGPTRTSNALSSIANLDPSRRSDMLLGQFTDAPVGTQAADVMNMITHGTTQSGQLSTRLQNGFGDSGKLLLDMEYGSSPTASLQKYLGSDESDTGAFLRDFDPTQTMGLQKTYDKLAAEGPTYEEDFYTSQLAGTNPAYQMLQDDLRQRLQRDAAARGGFTSGRALDLEQKGAARLAAEEFANRGSLASSAGAARRARLGQESDAAQALDAAFFGRQGLKASTGLEREGNLAGLALGREGNMTSLANARESLLAGMAENSDNNFSSLAAGRDRNELDKMGLLSDLGQFGDSQSLSLADLGLRGAGQEDDLQAGRQSALDQLAISGDQTDFNKRQLLADTAGTIDTTRMTHERDLDNLADRSEASSFGREKQLDDLFGKSGEEAFNGLQLGGTLAANAENAIIGRENVLRSGAQGASEEQATAARDKFNSALRLGDSQAAIAQAYNMAAIGAIQESEIAALDAQLAAAGVSAADRKATLDGLRELVKKAGEAWGNRNKSADGSPTGGYTPPKDDDDIFRS